MFPFSCAGDEKLTELNSGTVNAKFNVLYTPCELELERTYVFIECNKWHSLLYGADYAEYRTVSE